MDAVTAALAVAKVTLPQSHIAVGVGLAGANLASSQALLARWQHPFAGLSYTSDLHTALLGAHGGEDGAVLVVGTGSCAAAIGAGDFYQFGGHGFNLGDKGSGAWIGRQAVAYTLEALDGLVTSDPLINAVCEFYQCNSALALVDKLNLAAPAQFAAFAPHVLTLADGEVASAKGILVDGCRYLSAIARRALANVKGGLVLTGGLAKPLVPWFDDDIQQAITNKQQGPEWGAIYYYQQCRNHHSD
jgi:glucosamine kinase